MEFNEELSKEDFYSVYDDGEQYVYVLNGLHETAFVEKSSLQLFIHEHYHYFEIVYWLIFFSTVSILALLVFRSKYRPKSYAPSK